ncbi:MAG: indolepyruvate ferredoxin oxidoreductase family protein [Burkholderiaceae bacterium]
MNAPLTPAVSDALRRALKEVSLDDKYSLPSGRAFMSGTQALVRLPMLQRERDRAAGLNTAGFVSGYRGSPLGGVDQALWRAKDHLERHQIVFQPGLNEDLAATAVWGSQQVNLSPKANVDGVFALWYGKGPGVDRSGDVFKHANAAGSSRYGGALILAGDDHGAKSSTLPHQSDHIFKACGLPVFYPSSVQEYLDLGVHAWAMSRYSGLWMAMKTVTEVVEASASVDVSPDRVNIVIPQDFELPADGLNIRWPDSPLEQEARLLDYKFYAALAYVRANKLNRTVIDSSNAWFGIVTGGKAYLDTRQALEDLGLDEAACERIGVRLFKCDVVWPLEAQTISDFARGLGEVLVVEEKRQIMEYALKEELYNWPDAERPNVYGKFDEKDGRGGEWAMPMGKWLLPAHAELSPALIAKAIAARLLDPGKYGSRFELDAQTRSNIESRLAIIENKERALAQPKAAAQRVPTFCSGCPHNTSTHVPEGSRALAGIGCHYMATWMPERRTETFTQMGGEGVPWIGQSPFTDEKHIFTNLGDGTYFHSGLLAIRASIAAGTNITYKILYNDAVAMTGGQPIDGTLTVPQIVTQLQAEGAKLVLIVTDEPERYQNSTALGLPAGIRVHHRDELDAIQRELRAIAGCTILIYDQTCASEKRRRRKRIVDGKPGFPDPAKRVVINELVCEGCGDCSVQSSCVSVEPVETEFGRKRKINQSSCNKDFSCLKGFCPSFVTVEGGGLKKSAAKQQESAAESGGDWPALPEPKQLTIETSGNRTYGIMVTGVGGTGVVTVGQILGMAAHLEGKGVSVLDMAGLAQKGGAVFSHVQIAHHHDELHSTRIATGEADLLLGGDLVVSSGNEALSKMRPNVTRAVVNTEVSPTSDFLRDPDWSLPADELKQNIMDAAGDREIEFMDLSGLATHLLGDGLFANPMLIGYAWQKGWVPLNRIAIERAFELNGVAVKKNQQAFLWGRRLAHDSARVQKLAEPAQVIEFRRPAGKVRNDADLQALIDHRAAFLVGYQGKRYAKRYRALVEKVRKVEAERIGIQDSRLRLSAAVAKSLFKLMAYKDEYEVARLHTDPSFKARIAAQFEGDYTLKFHLAPPMISKEDPNSGRPAKRVFGQWMLSAMGLLRKGKFLRGTVFDPFGRTEERRQERASITEFEATIDEMIQHLKLDNFDAAIELAEVPMSIRGYGPVKEKNVIQARLKHAECLARLKGHDLKPIAMIRPAS